jgi:hypothetical protein
LTASELSSKDDEDISAEFSLTRRRGRGAVLKNLIRPAGSLAFIMLLTFAVVGCGDDGERDEGQDGPTTPAPRDRDVGSPRSFLLGLSSFPREPTDESYKQAFSLAGEVGELVLIQRSPPWSEFIHGGTLSKDTQDATQQEKALAEENGLDIFFAIDATDPADRGRLQGLPNNLTGKGFADQGVREGFLAYVKYVALNYKPRYLALGIEVNM